MSSDEPTRPDPDRLLTSLIQAGEREGRGRLKIFLGMSAGVGKTYAMLAAAHRLVREGRDVVVGVVETHGRSETAALLDGLVVIPRMAVGHRDTTIMEMDLDHLLALHPDVVLVDELAHTNAPGTRHPKRYQDVQELLDAGIDVYTTLNVQHLESRADNVRRITGIRVLETLPDSVVDQADDVELVDISPEDLLRRIREGRVYTGDRREQAASNFFRVGNLTALREMALRTTADHVDKELLDYRVDERIDTVWPARERFLVAIGPSPYAARLIRWTRQAAAARDIPWFAVYVRTPRMISEEQREQLTRNISLARELGAQDVVVLDDDDIASGLLTAARRINASTIVVGKPRVRGRLAWTFRTGLVSQLVEKSRDVDIAIVQGIDDDNAGGQRRPISLTPMSGWSAYPVPLLIGLALTMSCLPLLPIVGYQAVGLVLLVYVAILPMLAGRGPVLVTAALMAVMWDFFFIPPRLTFSIGRIEDRLTFVLYFIVALTSSVLSTRIRLREKVIRRRERRTDALYRLAHDLGDAAELDAISVVVSERLGQMLDVDVCLMMPDADDKQLSEIVLPGATYVPADKDVGVATWSYRNGKSAGNGTDTLPSADGTFHPLIVGDHVIGVLGLRLRAQSQEAVDIVSLGSVLQQIARAIERERLRSEAERLRMTDERERLYRLLLNTVSHEIRTPLAAIGGSAGVIHELLGEDGDARIVELLEQIRQGTVRLDRLVANLLDMTRIEGGGVMLRPEWTDMHDLVRSVVGALEHELADHPVRIESSVVHPFVKCDAVYMEHVLRNLLLNAAIYTPHGTDIVIRLIPEGSSFRIDVEDHGPGIPDEERSHVFDKFYRGSSAPSGGTGLGLAIVDGLVTAHGGTVRVEVAHPDREGNAGTRFVITIPNEEDSEVKT